MFYHEPRLRAGPDGGRHLFLLYQGRQFGPIVSAQRRRSKMEDVQAVGATYRAAGAHRLTLRLLYNWVRQRLTSRWSPRRAQPPVAGTGPARGRGGLPAARRVTNMSKRPYRRDSLRPSWNNWHALRGDSDGFGNGNELAVGSRNWAKSSSAGCGLADAVVALLASGTPAGGRPGPVLGRALAHRRASFSVKVRN
jgi:hypothetical protein